MTKTPINQGKKILIVDDDSFILNFLQIILKKAGFAVVLASQGEEWLLQARKEQPDIIISDIMMPTMDGIEFCQRVKSDPQLKDTLFLILTAKSSSQDRVGLLNLGADDFITKPIIKDELLAKINAFIRILDLQLELKKKNQDLLQLNQKLLQTTENLYHSNEKLTAAHNTLIQQEKIASIGQLAAGIAEEMEQPIHLLCNNLNVLNNYIMDTKALINRQELAIEQLSAGKNGKSQKISLELLNFKDQIDSEFILHDSDKVLAELISESERLKGIVEQLRDYFNTDLQLPRYANINDCLENSLSLLMKEIRGKVIVQKEYHELPEIKCYVQQLRQVFINVLLNAAQAIEANGTILLKTEKSEDQIIVSIKDDGVGIPKDLLPKIFEPFFTTKKIGKTIGLGLSVAQNIIENHNGRIEVASEIGTGTTVNIYLPISGITEEMQVHESDEPVTCIELN